MDLQHRRHCLRYVHACSNAMASIYTRCVTLCRRPQRAMIVGDSLTRDIRGAQRAGLKGIWLNREGDDGEKGIATACEEPR